MNIKNLILFISILFCLSFLPPQTKQGTVFIITKTIPYCGDANPSDEMVKEANLHRIPLGESFYIIAGEINTPGRKILGSLTVDASGINCVSLRPGTYSLLNKFLYKSLLVDENISDLYCMKKYWAMPLISFTVTKNKCDTIRYTVAENCPSYIPCQVGTRLPPRTD